MRPASSLSAAVLLVSGFLTPGHALENGHHAVYLEDIDGTRIQIAEIDVSDGAYSLEMTAEPFTDHFLSMRPFKCLEGPVKNWCHVPYPYTIRRNVSQDLTDLEYDFLFLWKGTTEYGINMWNGVYYQLESSDDGRIFGTLHEMDMDILSAPPEADNLRPIREVDLEPGEPDSHWLPVLVID